MLAPYDDFIEVSVPLQGLSQLFAPEDLSPTGAVGPSQPPAAGLCAAFTGHLLLSLHTDCPHSSLSVANLLK